METLGKIRRRHFVNGETISQIARDFHLTRKTVRKLVNNANADPKYVRRQQPQPKLGEFQGMREQWLRPIVNAPGESVARHSGFMKTFSARVMAAPTTACSAS